MTTRNTFRWLLAAVALVLCAACAEAQNATAKKADAPAETRPFAGETAGDLVKSPDKTGEENAPSYLPGLESVLRMVLWLAVLVVFIYAAVWLMRKYVPAARGMFGAGTLKIVGRLHVAARQSILLVKVGDRFVMVGVTAGSMTALTEIRDPEEAKRLTEELAEQQGAAPGSFGRALSKAGDAMAGESREADVSEVKGELDEVRRKVSWWRGQTKP